MRMSMSGVVLSSVVLVARGMAAQDATPLRFVSLSLGMARTCGVTTLGAVYCWGKSESADPNLTPTKVGGGLLFSTVSADANVACGVAAHGAAYCWGSNYRGLLGVDSVKRAAVSTPVPVAGGLSFLSLSVRDSHACGVTTAGAAYCWGGNREGELGTNDTVDRAAPTAVASALTFKTIVVGEWHTCGLTAAGPAYCWGDNEYGELGRATTETCPGIFVGKPRACSKTPVPVEGGLTFSMIVAGGVQTCGITGEGAAYCWGNNRQGQLGVGDSSLTTTTRPLAVAGGLRFTSIAAGAWHTCALAEEGHAYCWGQNDVGELGTARPTSARGPVRLWAPAAVSGEMTFRAIAAGGRHACGITSRDDTYCWGGNFLGSLGNGSQENSSVPVKVQEALSPAAAGTQARAQEQDSVLLQRVLPDSVLLRRALKARPEDLALGLLAEAYSLLAAKVAAAQLKVTVHTTLDGRDQTIDHSNAEQFVILYSVRIKTYDTAIRQRGFSAIAGTYQTTVSPQCARLGLSNGETTIKQQDSRFQLSNNSINHDGIVVESALAVEHAADPDIHLVGRATEGRIVLEHQPSKCILTLTRG
jgi:alpha-tubulin suppressor-like RCC1 family protein